MRSIESEGDSIDQAIDQALRALQVERERVEIEILADATRGLFGFGGKKARVRATVRAPLSARLNLSVDEAGSSREQIQPGAPDPPVAKVAPDPETAREPRNERRDRAPRRPPAVSQETVGREALSQMGTKARGVLLEILGHLGASCTVEVTDGTDGDGIVLEVKGDSSGLLIGRRGQMLDALEYIVNRIVARDEESGRSRVVVDVERYRERRREYLDTLARRLADKAKQTGRPVTLSPMSPRDRRIVHLALQEDAAISTRSQGQGYFRKLLIVPADRGRRPSRQSRPAS